MTDSRPYSEALIRFFRLGHLVKSDILRIADSVRKRQDCVPVRVSHPEEMVLKSR